MTDRELLERAARAAGIALERSKRGLLLLQSLSKEKRMGCIWNPLEDNGDAFMLAVKLKIDLIHDDPQSNDAFVMAGSLDHVEDVDGEVSRPAATRRAIVRAAAVLAKDAP